MAGTFWEFVETVSFAEPDRVVAVDDFGRSLTTKQLRDSAEEVAAGLFELGIRSGSVVSWQLPTTLESVVMLVACARLGAVQNPIITMLRSAEVGHIAGQIGTDLLVVPKQWRGFDHLAMANELNIASWSADYETPIDAATPLRLPKGDRLLLPAAPRTTDECRWVYYSSGTTAAPKGVRHTDVSAMASARTLSERLGFGPDDIYPIAWPFTHIGGIAMLVTSLNTGVRLVLFDVFDPATTADRMAAHKPTMLGSAVPFFRAFLEAEHRHSGGTLFTDVRGCVGGGASIPGEVNQGLVDTFGVAGVIGAYGLTEVPNCTCEWFDGPEVGRDVGPAGPGVSARVVDGELQLRGEQCFLGYVDESLNGAAFTADGWFRTGDLAEITDDERIRIVGRLKDVIIRNAENISATEIEEAVLFHDLVVDVAVIGLPDERTGERVCAAVVLVPKAMLSVSELAQHCIALGLAKYKCPEELVNVDVISRNAMGKIQKDKVREAVASALQAE
ncbi:MAG: AMP-binding protein [Acidimicrobiales bacterium]